ncbi:YafY family transcriptional regulator [Actinoplanes bogorensis]|uniref:YafY family transcriptional regulator n=1 Tax=Paractinoplanes bogorensis TaxID=1610840 RepID=A0ABS5YPV2_9ACTN|nr:YafY family protein [Actinoplanes bogorensis]MBU2664743.1 YafY family transcriptional regulator [Actinoplanes bogorensis]
MRADRLVAALLLMQARGRVTAAELATELEVSVATARRDLEALSAAGIPVYPQPGRHGGWQLVGGARTDLSGLSAGEAQALFLLAGPAAESSDEVKAALRKLVRALPETYRSQAQAAAGATLVDPAGWGAVHKERPDEVRRLQAAVVRQQRVRFDYRGAPRVADPYGVIDKDGVWYLIAGTDRGQRTFRLDRLAGLDVTGDGFERPADFDLDAAWAEVVGEMEDRRSRTWATVRIPARFAWVLRDHFGRHFHPVLDEGEFVRVRVGAPEPRDIARTLSGWGSAVEVLEPGSVRAELARIGSELADLYRGE